MRKTGEVEDETIVVMRLNRGREGKRDEEKDSLLQGCADASYEPGRMIPKRFEKKVKTTSRPCTRRSAATCFSINT